MPCKSKINQCISYYSLKQLFPFVKQKQKETNLDKDTKTLFFDVGQTFPAVTNLLHRYNCIVIHVSSNHTNLFQPFFNIFQSFNKSAKCFLADRYQDWYANEVWKH